MANNSAIAYHFGDRDGLLRSISRWRAGPIREERARLQRLAEEQGEADCPRRIIQIITRPVLFIQNPDGSHPHAAFVIQMLRSRMGREIRKMLFDRPTGMVGDLMRRLKRHVPDLSQSLFEFRLRSGALAFYDAIVERDEMAPDDPARLDVDAEAFLAELDAMLLSIILRPPAC
ncbi:hypothetical protein Q4610_07035 [Sphingobium sp. HBC34]|uniref:TetR family transcriptional regulator n=2 Tax=Sphingobium cyanobacteriorum TaxID=3063954 RepID=A0ABT8ZKC6_9SPHN|nr:hypothetical protein [Sphingobium sp. HBC34]MDO7834798.1 hypothetical protein [Sphingobium sp. HBC34]